jgi:colanic acid/amylovoran biosynthesis glycosyltransferase
MRLGYLIPEFPGQTHIFFWREIQALRRLGEQVFLVSTRRPSPVTCRHEFAFQAIAETRYLFPPASLIVGLWALRGSPGLLSALGYLKRMEASGFLNRVRQYALLASAVELVQWATLNQLDHIHGHSCADSAHVLAMARCMGGPAFSLTLHGDLSVYGGDHQLKLEQAAFVCAVGNHLRVQLTETAKVAEGKVFVTCMGVETSELALLGKHRNYNPGVLRLLTVARLEPTKGHLHALAAVRLARQAGLDVTYTIAGEGSFRGEIVSKIQELGLASCVELTGSVSESVVYKLLENSDAFVLPSVGAGEAWPVSVMEAMAAGLPVISSKIGATPEMITPGVDGFLVPQADENAIFEKIAFLAHDVEARRRIGNAGRNSAQLRFDVAATAQALRDAVNNCKWCDPMSNEVRYLRPSGII